MDRKKELKKEWMDTLPRLAQFVSKHGSQVRTKEVSYLMTDEAESKLNSFCLL